MTDEEVNEVIQNALLPAWRNGFSEGLTTAAHMAEAAVQGDELSEETQVVIHGLIGALKVAQGKILDESQTPAPEGEP